MHRLPFRRVHTFSGVLQCVPCSFPLTAATSQRCYSTTTTSSPSAPSTGTPGKVKVHLCSQLEDKECDVLAPVGMTLMEVIRDVARFDMEAACDGTCACSTCHVIFDEPSYEKLLERPCEDEMDMLDLAPAVCKTSRLSCQIRMTPELDGISVTIPDETDNQMR